MTSKRIMHYLFSNEKIPSGQCVTIHFFNKESIQAIFRHEFQIKEFAEQNLWFLKPVHDPYTTYQFDGDNVEKITIENIKELPKHSTAKEKNLTASAAPKAQ